MNLHRYFQAIFFSTLLINEMYFLFVKAYPYAVGVLGIVLLFLIIVEAFERGLSNIMFKTSQTELDITMVEKQLQQQSKVLAKKLAPVKKPAAIEQTTEIIQENLQQAFHRGLKVAGYTDVPEKSSTK